MKRRNVVDAERRLKHAVSQEKYHKRKAETHVRKQIWLSREKLETHDFHTVMIQKGKLEEWRATVKRFKKKHD
jgi:hypothetical protein